MSDPIAGEDSAAAAGTRTGPLTHLRVVEAGSFVAGPFCGQLFADFGAEVIKIEPPGRGDPMREWGRVQADDGQGVWWSVIGRGKKSVALDLRDPDHLETMRQLLRTADVFVENFRPGTLERLGLDLEALRVEHPRLVVVRISGYGQTGPYRERAGFGTIAEAFAGLRYITGDPDRPPVRIGISIGDALAGTFGTIGALAALAHREATGEGQLVDLAIYEAVLVMMEAMLAEASLSLSPRERQGSILPSIAPNNLYPTRDGQLIAIAGNADRVFERLAAALGRPELATDERFSTHHARGRNLIELDDLISDWTLEYDATWIDAHLAAAGVPSTPIHTSVDLLENPHIRARGMIATLVDPRFGELKMQSPIPLFDRTPSRIDAPAPELGEHTEEILEELRAAGS